MDHQRPFCSLRTTEKVKEIYTHTSASHIGNKPSRLLSFFHSLRRRFHHLMRRGGRVCPWRVFSLIPSFLLLKFNNSSCPMRVFFLNLKFESFCVSFSIIFPGFSFIIEVPFWVSTRVVVIVLRQWWWSDDKSDQIGSIGFPINSFGEGVVSIICWGHDVQEHLTTC